VRQPALAGVILFGTVTSHVTAARIISQVELFCAPVLLLALLIQSANLIVSKQQLWRQHRSTTAASLMFASVNQRLTLWAFEFHIGSAAERSELSHAGPRDVNREAEPKALPGVGCSDLLGGI
jgi:hypothetical protein